ncbi:MAG TPA: hypothetical protein VEX13_00825 [Chloroflexia bacterium]|nr:hypothetical protein [Chloroflexia bacterium]
MDHEIVDRDEQVERGDTGPAKVDSGAPADQVGSAPGASPRQGPTVLTLQDFIDLPGQILPEQTRYHLKNACREGALALFTLWQSINKATQSQQGGKVRKKIELE